MTGAGVTAGTKIVSAAVAGGAGAYTVNNSQTVGSESMTSAPPQIFISGQSRFNQFSNGGIDMNGDFSDWADVGSVFTGGFQTCLYLGPNTGGSTGNAANRFTAGRFEECNNGAVVLDGAFDMQFNDTQWQFNNGYAIQLVNSTGHIQVTGGLFAGNGTNATAAPQLSHINFTGSGTGFSVAGTQFESHNFAGGGNTHSIFSTSPGSNYDYVSLEGGDVKTGFSTAFANWAGNTPAHYKQSAPGVPPHGKRTSKPIY